ncbi:MAG: HNH endonuclease [Chloroflexi bacterium]|nr:MAG: HNH endonuclease [Chloroflexota bacterium]
MKARRGDPLYRSFMYESNKGANKRYFQSDKGKSSLRRAINSYFETAKGRLARMMAVQRYAAKKNGLPSSLTAKEWKQILIDFDSRCAYCGSDKRLIQEHFIPVSKGGEYTKRNIVPACCSCNNKKRNKHPADFLSAETYRRVANYLGV